MTQQFVCRTQLTGNGEVGRIREHLLHQSGPLLGYPSNWLVVRPGGGEDLKGEVTSAADSVTYTAGSHYVKDLLA